MIGLQFGRLVLANSSTYAPLCNAFGSWLWCDHDTYIHNVAHFGPATDIGSRREKRANAGLVGWDFVDILLPRGRWQCRPSAPHA